MVKKPVIFQVVGYQNSGKTTSVLKLIEKLVARNIRVVTIKHHGHGGKPDVLQKDSTRHCDAGSIASIVEGDGGLLLQADKDHWALEEQIQLLMNFQPDLILIEGYKHETYPKAVLLRSEADHHLLQELENIQLVLSWGDINGKLDDFENFPIKDSKWVLWLVDKLQKEINKRDKN